MGEGYLIWRMTQAFIAAYGLSVTLASVLWSLFGISEPPTEPIRCGLRRWGAFWAWQAEQDARFEEEEQLGYEEEEQDVLDEEILICANADAEDQSGSTCPIQYGLSVAVFLLVALPTLASLYLLARWLFRAVPYLFKEANVEDAVAAIDVKVQAMLVLELVAKVLLVVCLLLPLNICCCRSALDLDPIFDGSTLAQFTFASLICSAISVLGSWIVMCVTSNKKRVDVFERDETNMPPESRNATVTYTTVTPIAAA